MRFSEEVAGADLSANLSNIETVDMTGNGENALTALSAQDVLDMTDDDNVLSVLGDSEDRLTLSGDGWTDGGSADGFQLYVNADADGSDATLRVQEGVQIDI